MLKTFSCISPVHVLKSESEFATHCAVPALRGCRFISVSGQGRCRPRPQHLITSFSPYLAMLHVDLDWSVFRILLPAQRSISSPASTLAVFWKELLSSWDWGSLNSEAVNGSRVLFVNFGARGRTRHFCLWRMVRLH